MTQTTQKAQKAIHTDNAPAAIGPYSQAIRTGDTLYISGQIPLDPGTGEIVGVDDIAAQTKQVLVNMRAIVEAAGGDMSKIVKVNIFLTDLSNFGTVNELYAQAFSEPYPARACVEVSALPKGVQVEMDAIASL